MQKYDAIEKGIAENDVNGLRESIGSICYTCRDFSDGEFDEVVNYVVSKGISLFETDLNGELVSANKDTFTDEDFARAVFELKRNFCKERIADVKKIGETIYKKAPASTDTTKGTGTSPNAECHQTINSNKLKIAGLVAAGVAIVAVAVIVILSLK